MAGSSDDAPIVPQDVAYRWRFERDEAWAGSRRYREQRDMARNEVDRLRAELDRHRVAGDRVADRLARVLSGFNSDVQAWRSVRSGRGAAVWCEAAAEGDHDRDGSGVCRECGR